MRKKLLTIFFPVLIAIACSIAVWANEPSATQPPCEKCAKADKSAPCDNCAKDVKAAQVAPGCAKCAQMKAAEAKPCGGCDKSAKDAKAAEECAKLKAEGKPCGEKGCDKSAKLQQAEKKPCCDKTKAE